MPLNIKNGAVERLAAEVARLTGESKTEAIRRALDERRRRLKGLSTDKRRARVLRFLEKKVWPTLPAGEQGRRLSRAEEDDILGYGPSGVSRSVHSPGCRLLRRARAGGPARLRAASAILSFRGTAGRAHAAYPSTGL